MFKSLIHLVTGLALISATIAPSVAQAQVAPGNQTNGPAMAYAPQPTSGPQTLGDLPSAIVLDDVIYAGERPRAISKENVRRDAPIVTYEEFKRDYKPRRGSNGELLDPDADTLYRIIAGANKDLCDEAGMMLDELVQIDTDYALVDQDYILINEIYNGLPKKLKRGAAVMTIGQAAQTGALCALSLGLYCIAAVAGGIGNIFSTHSNLKLQLANVKLSIVNIRHSRNNIRHSRITVRMDALWLRAYVPYCRKIMPGFTAADLPAYGRQDANVTYSAPHH